MFTVTADALLKSVCAADANEDAGLGQVIDFFATEPQPARELLAVALMIATPVWLFTVRFLDNQIQIECRLQLMIAH